MSLQYRQLAADDVGAAGGDHNGGHAAAEGVLESLVLGVYRVDGPQVRCDRVGHLVHVHPGPALGFLGDTHVRVPVDQTGHHVLTSDVYRLRLAGDGQVGGDGEYLAALHQYGAALDVTPVNRDHSTAAYG
ncbi:MAG: hypothetical protein M1401_16550 [Chloroflexi bacterium]|nr:hypothetical protein [Chloroflexota bacterium]